jgi:uncharacterized membrane protein YkgB
MQVCPRKKGNLMSLGTIILIILILMLIGAFPSWPHSANWGYFPSGALGTILVIVLILVLLGRI